MTALSGPILFNNSTGSDSTSSGCGPSVAVTETITTTAASSSATVTSGSGYSVGDLMYIPSATGRKFNVIATISGTTVTFDNIWDDSLTSVSAYIGGKRATFDGSEQLFQTTYNPATYMDITMETDQTVTIDLCGVGAIGCSRYIKSDNPSTRRKISYSGGTYLFKGGRWYLYDLELESMSGSNRYIAFAATTGTVQSIEVTAYNCILGNSTNPWYQFGYQSANPVSAELYGCVVQDFLSTVFYAFNPICNECLFKNNDSYIYASSPFTTSPGGGVFTNCLMTNNAEGFYSRWGWNGILTNCVINNCGTTYPAFHIYNTDKGKPYGPIERNIFTNCSSAVNSSAFWLARGNAYYNCGWSGFTNELNPITLTADPFVDAANGDFNINNDAGGGKLLRDTTFDLNSSTQIRPFHGFAEPLQPTRSKHPLAR